jgi:PhnB protein
MAVQPVPAGYHSVTPYVVVDGAAQAIEFYKKAFGAIEMLRVPRADGKVMHAEVKIGDSPVMLADEVPEMNAKNPLAFGGSPMSLMIYVDDVDQVFARALELGGTEVRPLQNHFYGDRSGTLSDPFGHQWTVATHVEDVSDEEIQRRLADEDR